MGTRSTSILKGTSMNDVFDDVGGTGYKYYGFTRSDKSWVIMRVNAAETEYRYAVGSPNSGNDKIYTEAWAIVTTLNYATSDKYKY